MLSPRYALPVLAVFALALLPTVWNFYRCLPVSKDHVTITLHKSLAGWDGQRTDRKARTIVRIFRTTDWVERMYTDKSGRKVTLFAARSYDGRPFIHMPERGILRTDWIKRTHKLRILKKGLDLVKVHSVRLSGKKGNVWVSYILLCGQETIGNPYLFLLRRFPRLLLGEREPFTLIFVYCREEENPENAEQAIESLFFPAVDCFLNKGSRRMKTKPVYGDLFRVSYDAKENQDVFGR